MIIYKIDQIERISERFEVMDQNIKIDTSKRKNILERKEKRMQKQKFIHVSFDPVEKFEPKIPQNRAPEEDQTIRRICCIRTGKDMKKDIMKALNASPCAGEALNRIASFGFYPVLHVYEMDSQDYLLPDEVQKYVPDAYYSGECWLTKKPVSFIHKCYEVTWFKTKEVSDNFGTEWQAVVALKLEKLKKTETNWERYRKEHPNSVNDKLLQIVHSMDIGFKSFALTFSEEEMRKLTEKG